MRELATPEIDLTFAELDELKSIGKKVGFQTKELRLEAYRKILFRKNQTQISEICKKLDSADNFDSVKESDVIDKDAARSQFYYFEGDELVDIFLT